LDIMRESFDAARTGSGAPLYLQTLGLGDDENACIARDLAAGITSPDPVVPWLIGDTSGHAYEHSIGKLTSYPIPDIPLDEGRGRTLLDVGCNWGRWSLAAARKGFRVTGIDPSLGALLAARRVGRELGLDINLVCGDARCLPFADASFDQVFSYSVIQHFSIDDGKQAIGEMGRVLRPGGALKVQMAHALGVRSLYHQIRRGLQPRTVFDVRYWMLPHLREAFERAVGSSEIRAEGFGGLGLLYCDRDWLSARGRALVTVSEGLRRVATALPSLAWAADSVYVQATKR
jgi:SAM-dependent methyltransferase